MNLCIVISSVGLHFMEKFLEGVGAVAVHDGYYWLDEGLCVGETLKAGMLLNPM